CVQQESCAPMVRAFQEDSATIRAEHIVRRPQGIAEAILRGDPTRAYPYVRDIVRAAEGTFVAVCETEIRGARRMGGEYGGLSPSFAASAAVAGVVRLVRQGHFPRNDCTLINLTGRDRPHGECSSPVHWLYRSPHGWVSEGGDPGGRT